jgi:hypothetical protein
MEKKTKHKEQPTKNKKNTRKSSDDLMMIYKWWFSNDSGFWEGFARGITKKQLILPVMI